MYSGMSLLKITILNNNTKYYIKRNTKYYIINTMINAEGNVIRMLIVNKVNISPISALHIGNINYFPPKRLAYQEC